MVNWKGRYSLESKAASHSKSSKQSKKKTGDRNLRKRSEHEFLVQGASILRLYLNTLNSGAIVRYSVLNSNGEPVMSNNEFTDFLIEFDRVYPVPGANQYKPFKLVIEYESQVEQRE